LDEEEDEDDEGDDDEDDGSIVPMYASFITAAAQAPAAVAAPVPEPTSTPLPLEKAKVRAQGQALALGRGRAQGQPSTAQSQAQAQAAAMAWKTFFPFFGAIFPVSFGASGPGPSSNNSGSGSTPVPMPALTPHTHKAIAACLETQSKMYDEWLEVMADYSTALSVNPAAGSRGNASSSRTKHYRVNSSRSEVYSIVTDVLRSQACLAEWEELPAGLGLGATWNLLWTWSKPKLNLQSMLVWQRVNHFHDSKQLTRKDLLKKNLQRYTDMGRQGLGQAGEAFEIMPQTFLLPHEYIHFVQAFQEVEMRREEAGVQNYWIM